MGIKKRKTTKKKPVRFDDGTCSFLSFSKKALKKLRKNEELRHAIEVYENWYAARRSEAEKLCRKCTELERTIFEKSERIMDLEDELKELKKDVQPEEKADTGSPAACEAAE